MSLFDQIKKGISDFNININSPATIVKELVEEQKKLELLIETYKKTIKSNLGNSEIDRTIREQLNEELKKLIERQIKVNSEINEIKKFVCNGGEKE